MKLLLIAPTIAEGAAEKRRNDALRDFEVVSVRSEPSLRGRLIDGFVVLPRAREMMTPEFWRSLQIITMCPR